MSHVADVDLRITDLAALKRAAEELGFELVEGATTYQWYGRFLNDWSDSERAAGLKGFDPKTFGQCEHKLRIKGAPAGTYEIGLVKHPEGGPGWVPIYDAWAGGQGVRDIQRMAGGDDLRLLKQGYSREVSMAQIRKQGFVPQIVKKPNGAGYKIIGRKA